MKDLLLGLLSICAVLGAIYGGYILVKTTSYSLFYESMVQETISETVKPSCLVEVAND